MKKRATLILQESQARQQLLDSLNQTVQNFVDSTGGDRFDYASKAAIMSDVIDCINSFRTIERTMMVRLSKSYTQTTYTAFDFIVKVPTPQFTDLRAIQSYYTKQIAQMIAEITAEEAETRFIDDGLGQGTSNAEGQLVGNDANIVYNKDSGNTDWNDAENTILGALATINSTLMGDVPNVS